MSPLALSGLLLPEVGAVASAAVPGTESVAGIAVSADHHVAVVLLSKLEKVRVLDTPASGKEY